MRFLTPLLSLFPFAETALNQCDAALCSVVDGAASRTAELFNRSDDLASRCDVLEARLSHFEAFPNHDHAPAPTPGDAPWPAPPGLTWLRIPEGAQAQDGEAQDVNGRSLRIPDPQAPGFVRALVPASPVAGAEMGATPPVTFG